MLKVRLLSLAAAVSVAGIGALPALAQGTTDETLARMLAGESATQGDELAAIEQAASAYPLGSKENPVRATMPSGQRAYLARLRCANLKAPQYSRIGQGGISPYGNIVDVYSVTCEGSEPASRQIYLDMYHGGYVEDRAVEGYGIVGGTAD